MGTHRFVLKAGYHFFATTPAVHQLVILVRAAVNLSAKRGLLGERNFHHLITKEVGRALVTGHLCVSCLCAVPSFVCSGALSVKLGSVLTLLCFGFSSVVYNILARVFIIFFKSAYDGIPIITFSKY